MRSLLALACMLASFWHSAAGGRPLLSITDAMSAVHGLALEGTEPPTTPAGPPEPHATPPLSPAAPPPVPSPKAPLFPPPSEPPSPPPATPPLSPAAPPPIPSPKAPLFPSPSEPPSPPPAAAPAPAPGPQPPRSFEIREDRFWVNGVPTQIVSGSIHYFRIHPRLWEDRLRRVRSLGLNAIQTYVPWNLHEPQPDVLDFSGLADLEAFLRAAQRLDLMVLLRIGPYICGEWDLGGLPSWLLTFDPKLKLRSSDPAFLAEVDKWWGVLLPRVKPLLWAQGGPVVMVQVENEFGWLLANDTAYLQHLVNTTKTFLGNDTVVYTTDPAFEPVLGNGTLPGDEVFTAVDAQVQDDYAAAFALQKLYNAPGKSPPMATEFYLGWLTHWGEAMPADKSVLAASQVQKILAMGGSVNFYMAHGGTSFGFNAGANRGKDKHQYLPDITSYDYTAPVGEGGELTSPYYAAVRDTVSTFFNRTAPAAPDLLPRLPSGTVNLTHAVRLLDAVPALSTPPAGIPSIWPKEMEFFNQASGFILYTATLPTVKLSDMITIFGVKDRAQVFVTTPAVPASEVVPAGGDAPSRPVRRPLGMLERWTPQLKLPLASAAPAAGDQIQILVEEMGRANFGKHLIDEKKGVGAVMLGFIPIFHWTVNPLPLTNPSSAPFVAVSDLPTGTFEPTLFRGTFHVDEPADTYLSLRGWTKGVAFVNGFNLGRYWPVVGPQCHLYIPAPLLLEGENELILLELDGAPATLQVALTNATDFSCGPVPLVPTAPSTNLLQTTGASTAASVA